MEDDEECSTGLCLGLGMGGYMPKKENQKVNKVERFMYLEKIPERLQHYPTKSTDSDHNTDNKNTCRKKLRLTTEQSAMLENCFKLHTTLNPVQKQALADKLNLKTRQIEVWFQNRRARTKLKKTEVDHELLKKQCQNLSDENRRLKKELQELRALKVGESSALCIQLSKRATLAMCSSCQKLLKLNEGNNNFSNNLKSESDIDIE
ncbi:homeobox-leucine zipper protein HAT22-like [Lotus japonicus]|uniref:homeobox-leucine zipper protein HAT22-like n=1 Tax=Lotus japonicus TaxID=34305 RepID=UPI0025879AB8|nr:homeobox-leucine zipper protein HAT22-like [Lotus japonicus]